MHVLQVRSSSEVQDQPTVLRAHRKKQAPGQEVADHARNVIVSVVWVGVIQTRDTHQGFQKKKKKKRQVGTSLTCHRETQTWRFDVEVLVKRKLGETLEHFLQWWSRDVYLQPRHEVCVWITSKVWHFPCHTSVLTSSTQPVYTKACIQYSSTCCIILWIPNKRHHLKCYLLIC